jgi:hypothetical protein
MVQPEFVDSIRSLKQLYQIVMLLSVVSKFSKLNRTFSECVAFPIFKAPVLRYLAGSGAHCY